MDRQNIASLKNRRLTLKQYLQLPHAMILTGDQQAAVERRLAALGVKRRVALRIPFLYSGGVCHCADRFSSDGAQNVS